MGGPSATRREFSKLAAGGLVAASIPLLSPQAAFAQAEEQEEFESQFSEPDEAPQVIAVNQQPISEIFRLVAFGIKKDARTVAENTMTIAESYIGENQDDNPKMLERFFAVFKMNSRDPGGHFYPFCAAGLSYCASQAYCDVVPKKIPYNSASKNDVLTEALSDVNRFYFRPNPLVKVMKENSERRGTWTPSSALRDIEAKRGWLIVFHWRHDGHPNHIGLIESHSGTKFETIEFNTRKGTGNQARGGNVLRKTRNLVDVLGVVRTYPA